MLSSWDRYCVSLEIIFFSDLMSKLAIQNSSNAFGIKFLMKLNKMATEYFRIRTEDYGEEYMSRL